MNIRSSRMREQLAQIIRDEVRQILKDELKQLVEQKSTGHQSNDRTGPRKVRRLRPVPLAPGAGAQGQQQAGGSIPQQLPSREDNGMQRQGAKQPLQSYTHQQLAQEMESNLLRLKKIISETQALAEKMESFLAQSDQFQ